MVEIGRWEIVFNAPNYEMVFYEDDNITEMFRVRLFDAAGNPANPATTAVAERTHV